jgi:outer membrane lipoprotein SlyB
MRATGRWWRLTAAPALRSHWPALTGALLGGVLCALIGCGRGPACPQPKHAAIGAGNGGQSSQGCEVRK